MDIYQIELPVTTFIFKQILRYNPYTYRILDIKHTKQFFQYSSSSLLNNLHKKTTTNSEIVDNNGDLIDNSLKMYNDIMVPYFNSLCVNFSFEDMNGNTFFV